VRINKLAVSRNSMKVDQEQFLRLLEDSHIPAREDPIYNKAIRQRHAAILGICALVDSYPYTVEKWMPELLTNILAEHTYDPVSWTIVQHPFKHASVNDLIYQGHQIPISTTVRKCAGNFKRTHQDTWHEDSKSFNESQLAALSTLLTGSSYCAIFWNSLADRI
jgi:proteasome activator subunit 4